MKGIITADHHITNGIRKEIFINFIDHLIYYTKKHSINYVFFLGDLFDKPALAKLRNETFIDVFFKLQELEKQCKLYFIIGNHTIHRIDNKDNIVNILKPFSKVISEKENITIDNSEITLMPYVDNFDEIPETGDILFSHFPVKGLVYSGQKEEDEKGVPPEKFAGFNKVFLGDIHKNQIYKNIHIPGPPYQTNYGERHLIKTGFYIFDFETKKEEFIEYDEAPKYKQLKIEEVLNESIDVSNCFVKVEITDKTENFVKLKHLLFERGALEVLPEFKTNDEEFSINGEINVDLKNNMDELLMEYIDTVETKLDKEKIKKILSKVIS